MDKFGTGAKAVDKNTWMQSSSSNAAFTGSQYSNGYGTSSTWTVPADYAYSYIYSSYLCLYSGNYHYRYNGYFSGQYISGSRPAPSISIVASPSSGTPSFISTVSIMGLGFLDRVDYYNVTAPNSSIYTLTSPNATINIDSEGLWVVRAQAHNSGGSSSAETTITGNSQDAPVAAFSCSPTNTTSPALVTCTDSSTHLPTSWLWQLTSYGVQMSPGGSYGAGIFSAVNSTQNPTF